MTDPGRKEKTLQVWKKVLDFSQEMSIMISAPDVED